MEVKKELSKMKLTMRKVFGIEKLRPGQEEVIRLILAGQSTLAIMPTGAGKSLCYQIPALHLPGTTVIISPLISLMKDQVDKLGQTGIDAAQVNSALNTREREKNAKKIEQQTTEFVFTTPERLATPEFIKTLNGHKIDFVVIDESHCISEWGHDFRPSYLRLGAAIKAMGAPPVLALTATATPEVIADIQKQLDVGKMRVINTGIYRPNLHYELLRVTNEELKQQYLSRLFSEIEGTGIVYCATVKAVNAVTELFHDSNFTVRPYHGKMHARERKENQDMFMRGALKAMIATNAFGMGIDKPDIRFVMHYQMPGSLEAYYQESGRAGRDEEPARCVLFYQLDDRRTQLYFMTGRYPKTDDVIAVYEGLKSLSAKENTVQLSQIQESASQVAKKKVHVILHLLKEIGIVREARYARFKLLSENLDPHEIETLSRECLEKAERDRPRLDQMMLYGQSASCRWKLLHDYFNEPFPQARCGNCDNCVHPLEEQIGEVTQM